MHEFWRTPLIWFFPIKLDLTHLIKPSKVTNLGLSLWLELSYLPLPCSPTHLLSPFPLTHPPCPLTCLLLPCLPLVPTCPSASHSHLPTHLLSPFPLTCLLFLLTHPPCSLTHLLLSFPLTHLLFPLAHLPCPPTHLSSPWPPTSHSHLPTCLAHSPILQGRASSLFTHLPVA